MKKVIGKILNIVFSFCKVNEKRILFESGRHLVDGNPRALYCYIKENCPNDFETFWLVEKGTNVDSLKKGEFVYYKTFKSLYLLATSKYWVKSQSLGNIIKKKKNQIYIQTWHGHGALKKMGYDIANEKNCPPMEHVKEWDYFISSDPLDEQIIISSTGYNKKCLMLGAACTDEILKINNNIEKKNKIKKQLGIKEKDFCKRVILYAPTFRELDLEKESITLNISKLSKLTDSIILVRLHPLIKEKVDRSLFKGNIINACSYPDSSELLPITDILISDYSSIIYEFAILNRPIVFYDYDIDLYLKERGLYLDYKTELPGPVVFTENELLNTIKKIDDIMLKYQNKLDDFNSKYNFLHDGHVCERTIKCFKEGVFK